VLFGWRWLFRRRLQPRLARWAAAQPRASAAVLGVALLAGATGLQPEGPLAIARVSIASTTYYGLAQNPIWQTADAWLLAFGPEEHGTVARARQIMPLEEAIALTRQVVAPAADFASDRYPLVRRTTRPAGARHPRPDNVLLLFVEGLDRRYVGPRLTPFLDRWGREAVVFENFFANGELTHHGLFTTLCSHLSGLGKSPIKARYTNDFLCLPALLQRAGYWTEMVIGYNRDHHQDHTALFLARNGIRQFLDEGNFDAGRERMGLGVTDGALLDELRERIRALRQGAQPFFLTALTVSTHHPFVVPARDPAVATLLREPDRYPATLRYVDGELARFFTELERDGSLDDTVVVLLGDHGRHEVIGETDYERWLGRHLTPLFVWMPPALRAETGLRPRRVSAVASQVDVTPTLLGLLGLTPPLTPFTGQDLSGLLVGDRHVDGEAVLLTSHSAALADARGILVYGLNSEQVRGSDLALRDVRELPAASPDVADRVRRLKALVVASTILVAENRVWSWAQFGRTLASPTVAEPIRGRPR
jgi:arylsulfatase A-like enzyme